ncbi:MAG: hypothetical protein ACPGZP_05810 [Panacagrimonas sp.]
MLKRLTSGMKDGALSLAAKSFINDRLSDYGRLTECHINTHKSQITVTAMLKGEKAPIKAVIEKYDLECDGDVCYVTVRTISTDRPWITLMLTKLIGGKRYKLPAAVGNLL